MPVYAYFCETCLKDFEMVLTIKEHDEKTIVCPNCGSDRLHQTAATFTAVTSKKS
jgi:putative FmdB family regulatory protein